jgi:hypothetical protein
MLNELRNAEAADLAEYRAQLAASAADDALVADERLALAHFDASLDRARTTAMSLRDRILP